MAGMVEARRLTKVRGGATSAYHLLVVPAQAGTQFRRPMTHGVCVRVTTATISDLVFALELAALLATASRAPRSADAPTPLLLPAPAPCPRLAAMMRSTMASTPLLSARNACVCEAGRAGRDARETRAAAKKHRGHDRDRNHRALHGGPSRDLGFQKRRNAIPHVAHADAQRAALTGWNGGAGWAGHFLDSRKTMERLDPLPRNVLMY